MKLITFEKPNPYEARKMRDDLGIGLQEALQRIRRRNIKQALAMLQDLLEPCDTRTKEVVHDLIKLISEEL
jgi:hypothetical protein